MRGKSRLLILISYDEYITLHITVSAYIIIQYKEERVRSRCKNTKQGSWVDSRRTEESSRRGERDAEQKRPREGSTFGLRFGVEEAEQLLLERAEHRVLGRAVRRHGEARALAQSRRERANLDVLRALRLGVVGNHHLVFLVDARPATQIGSWRTLLVSSSSSSSHTLITD